MNQFGRLVFAQARQYHAHRFKLNAAFRQPAADGGGVNRVVAANGVFGNENLQAAFKTFSGGGADAGVKMNARENDRVAIHPPERGIERCRRQTR